ncbi:zinc-binding dehydrogenase [Polyangium sp. y55x31]|uniref:zinc-dependent alcohol dehydrogenase n=1 Tax=Polyangium sp. y55x31 TaxID=3042688 RepID=UPI002482E070|nr:zinc-binding dehydrogenase [Polyangium sp. y55x31]MDI1477734.1 zinc-binding dehydrogenase [Polyangium sp. y55x31]
MTRARAIWFERPGVAVLRDEPLPDPGPHEALVRTLACGVSAGTERLVLTGRVPPDIRAVMALPTQRGSFDLPTSYGYAAVGVVEAIGAATSPDLLGRTVFALHPHHDRFISNEQALRRLPDGIPAPRATLAANLETALNAVWDAEIALGEQVVVVGLGVVGQLVARLATRAGGRVVCIDPDERRAALARELGCAAALPSIDAAIVAEADVLVEASGSPEALAALVASAGHEARILVVSWYGEHGVTLPLGGRFHPNRVTIRSSQVGTIPPARRARFTFERRFSVVNELLHDACLDRLVGPLVPFTDAPRLYASLAAGDAWNPPHRVLDPSR